MPEGWAQPSSEEGLQRKRPVLLPTLPGALVPYLTSLSCPNQTYRIKTHPAASCLGDSSSWAHTA